jgi:hypothetical protein
LVDDGRLVWGPEGVEDAGLHLGGHGGLRRHQIHREPAARRSLSWRSPDGEGSRDHEVKQALACGETILGIFVPILATRVVELCGLAASDYVVVDAEHGPIDVVVPFRSRWGRQDHR